MIKSMTGYGKSFFESKGKLITVEIKSLNSKQCDIFIKIPPVYRETEPEIRNILMQKLERGKIELFVNVEYPQNYSQYTINSSIFYKYHDALTLLANDTKDKTKDFIPVIMRLPDVLVQGKEEPNTEEVGSLHTAINEAVEMLDKHRINEGNELLKDFQTRNQKILTRLPEIEKHEKQRIEGVRTKINAALLAAEAEKNIDKNRFEQELIYYLEKLDFTEEKVRLKQHCQYFMETLSGLEANGRKLLFITQEMGREMNTLGSKANHFEIQKIVVEMKDELEKMKEQLLNVL